MHSLRLSSMLNCTIFPKFMEQVRQKHLCPLESHLKTPRARGDSSCHVCERAWSIPSQRESGQLKYIFHRAENQSPLSASNCSYASVARKVFGKPHTTSEALENLHQVGVFTQVNLAEQQLQKWQIKRLLQFGENVVHYSGYRDQVATGFQRFLKKGSEGLLHMIIKWSGGLLDICDFSKS